MADFTIKTSHPLGNHWTPTREGGPTWAQRFIVSTSWSAATAYDAVSLRVSRLIHTPGNRIGIARVHEVGAGATVSYFLWRLTPLGPEVWEITDSIREA